jgi:hypothetical protein
MGGVFARAHHLLHRHAPHECALRDSSGRHAHSAAMPRTMHAMVAATAFKTASLRGRLSQIDGTTLNLKQCTVKRVFQTFSDLRATSARADSKVRPKKGG